MRGWIDTVYMVSGFVVLGVCSILVIRVSHMVSQLKDTNRRIRQRTAAYMADLEKRRLTRGARDAAVGAAGSDSSP